MSRDVTVDPRRRGLLALALAASVAPAQIACAHRRPWPSDPFAVSSRGDSAVTVTDSEATPISSGSSSCSRSATLTWIPSRTNFLNPVSSAVIR